uniref:VWFD domain-containing protein n=1 Tax=Takifugu rubripes TaxID=31033 RepID=H2UA48_TAKRU
MLTSIKSLKEMGYISLLLCHHPLGHNHVGSICSTWGREHFRTFDGDVYQFPGLCEYNLVSDCHESFQEFSVHIRRKVLNGNPTVSHVVHSLFPRAKMPYYNSGVQVEKNAVYFKLQSKVGIVVMWNGEDAVMVELDSDYTNRTCGLCGDFNGISDSCREFVSLFCETFWKLILTLAFPHNPATCLVFPRIDPEAYIQACAQDMCGCTNTSDFCICSTLSEFSRQCSHAGGQPPNWRTSQFCAKQCPYNMVYEESGSPCVDTCTHLDTSSLCEDHKMDGCFCPPGTVYDDISMRGCINQSDCQCKHSKIYNPGEVFRRDTEECMCLNGWWSCKSLQKPSTCAVGEGSHVTTFDGKTYTFHGDCYYTLAKVESKTVKIILNNDRNNVSEDQIAKTGVTELWFLLGDISIFHASSFHIILQTTFGLQIQVQHVPLMQIYVSLDQNYRTKTRGLCGNYNMIMSDDMTTPQGIVEGTAATFCNSWKTSLACKDRTERLDDPCSLSVENENYAKHWCDLLLRQSGPFANCSSLVDPDSYYKRCLYASCNCEKSEACLCAVFSSYARACASNGVFLTNWREDVCGRPLSCPASQTFSYKHQRCQLTCRSLGSNQQSCMSDFLPVDGCSCAEGLYLNENGMCVPMAKCSCFYNDAYIKPGKSISINDEHCLIQCLLSKCKSKEHINVCIVFCDSVTSICPSSQDSMECESGCWCPTGLLDDGKGSCVKESDCTCQHDGHLYAPGSKINNECNTCTCKSGTWECTKIKCPGTCIIYGSGHYSTYDKITYGFRGDCAYVAVKVNNVKQYNTFGVITENVPCGSTGTTCSKTVRVQLGVSAKDVSCTNLHFCVFCTLQKQGKVCGLCGDFNGDGQNDFTTQGGLVVNSVLEFANSWKAMSTCPDAGVNADPCVSASNRQPWAKMMCSIITGETFRSCHNTVAYQPFYENCVKDSCACDTGGDCECFCTAVAAYAQACNEAGVCIAWRTPEICQCPTFSTSSTTTGPTTTTGPLTTSTAITSTIYTTTMKSTHTTPWSTTKIVHTTTSEPVTATSTTEHSTSTGPPSTTTAVTSATTKPPTSTPLSSTTGSPTTTGPPTSTETPSSTPTTTTTTTTTEHSTSTGPPSTTTSETTLCIPTCEWTEW